ncbi:hypothetical protein BOTBODRAFT_31069 [Botryobasidium botryosum FD-172 SS1]|uniref:Uncharacterized protein n=1 Tax=Botryobasidium botryosum (strain FD-172 SS1) TaxID=930990 RepID=A0A067MXZ6_BOTB1|nr:hypothetical protein BOTBODRAFT_31069 [Botryobasidium botryosum FD-172 SS1]
MLFAVGKGEWAVPVGVFRIHVGPCCAQQSDHISACLFIHNRTSDYSTHRTLVVGVPYIGICPKMQQQLRPGQISVIQRTM